MIHQPPAGARDLLPLEVNQKAHINDTLQRVFQGWGYRRIVTSTLEWMDTLKAGGAVEPETVMQLRNTNEGALGLRPELTASIARAAVTRMADTTFPQRLCYRANVFRNPPAGHHGGQVEFYQAGVELLFTGGLAADGETLLLLGSSLEALAIDHWQLILGDAGFTSSLMELFPGSVQSSLRHALARLDRVAIETMELSGELKDLALWWFELRGEPAAVIEKLVARDLPASVRARIDYLKSLWELLSLERSQPLPLVIDLSLIHTFDYYTGIIFEAVSFANHQTQILGQGGRYDGLLGIYSPKNESYPGIGFSFNVEEIHRYLNAHNLLAKELPTIDVLVIPSKFDHPPAIAQAFAYAEKLRTEQQLKVKVALTKLERQDQTALKAYALSEYANKVVWVEPTGAIEEIAMG